MLNVRWESLIRSAWNKVFETKYNCYLWNKRHCLWGWMIEQFIPIPLSLFLPYLWRRMCRRRRKQSRGRTHCTFTSMGPLSTSYNIQQLKKLILGFIILGLCIWYLCKVDGWTWWSWRFLPTLMILLFYQNAIVGHYRRHCNKEIMISSRISMV